MLKQAAEKWKKQIPYGLKFAGKTNIINKIKDLCGAAEAAPPQELAPRRVFPATC
jgi:hypothetical protein